MATRLKTIQFALPTYTSTVGDASDTSIGTGTTYTPENSLSTPINIISCFLEIGWQDVCTVAGTIGEHRVSLTLSGASTSSVTETDDITNTGENMGGVIGPFNFTSYAIANYGTNSSLTYEVSVYFDFTAGTTLGVNNVTSILTLTYEYDDTVTTQIKTVKIPFESNTTGCPIVETELGTNQIPLLDTFLPEDSIVIRDYYIIMEGNQSAVNPTTTDITLSFKIDSGAEYNTGTQEKALASDIFVRNIWSLTYDYPSTSSQHSFKFWANVASFDCTTFTLVVTYEFNATNTTTVLNSIIIPMEVGSPMGLDAMPSRFSRYLMIQEPETIIFKQSSVRINYNAVAPVAGLNIRVGSQTYRNYNISANVNCGMNSFQQRIDSGSAAGAGLSLARGRNSLVLDMYRTDTADDPTNLNGYFLINYHSGKATDGVGAHSHTIFYNLFQWDALLSDRLITTFTYYLPNSDNYWINGIGVLSIIWDGVAGNAFTMDVEVKEGEGKGGGYEDLYADAIQSDAERRCSMVWMRGRDVFKRHPKDPDPDRIDANLSRTYRFFTPVTTQQGIEGVITYHNISYPISGVCTNYGGDGEGLVVNFFRAFDDTKILSLTTTTGGTFSDLWYDNTEYIYCVIRDSNRVGRSQNGYAG